MVDRQRYFAQGIVASYLHNLAPAAEQKRLMKSLGFLMGVFLLCLCLLGGVFVLYTASGQWTPWAWPHAWRSMLGMLIVISIVLLHQEFWYRHAYHLYLLNLVILALIPLFGVTAMGAQRWFVVGSFFIQPSEPMKIFTILALVRYFHDLATREIALARYLVPPLIIVLLPVGLTLSQPDLGTSIMLLLAGGVVFFLAGVRLWKFALVLGLSVGSAPLMWVYVLHDFQKSRILSFIDPQVDLLGSGYQLMQSKIAIGAGGVFGQGLMSGSQSLLGFIPAKHTDFIFSHFAEQFGLWGGGMFLMLLLILLLYGFQCTQVSRSTFGKLLAMSIVLLWMGQSLINLAMVMGMLPVVGTPLPFFSYGGTSLWTSMIGFGFVLNVYVHQHETLKQPGSS